MDQNQGGREAVYGWQIHPRIRLGPRYWGLWPVACERRPTRRLMTVPGVAPVTAARFVAALDDVGRFPNTASVAS